MAARPSNKIKPQHKPAYRRLVKRLLEIRQQSGHTQRSLAKAIRLPASTIHKIEHGDRRVDPIEFARWCRACKADPGKTLNQL
ncbi:MAG: helix-turn-helix transcriptional regulator [Planctomycetota bacterium]